MKAKRKTKPVATLPELILRDGCGDQLEFQWSGKAGVCSMTLAFSNFPPMPFLFTPELATQTRNWLDRWLKSNARLMRKETS